MGRYSTYKTTEFVWENIQVVLANYDKVTCRFLEKEQEMCQVCLSHLVKLNVTLETLWQRANSDTFKRFFKDIRNLHINQKKKGEQHPGTDLYNWCKAVFFACVIKMKMSLLDPISINNEENKSLLTNELNYNNELFHFCCTLFENLSQEETDYLISFQRYMHIARLLLGPKASKDLMINTCSILEGSGKRYVTGGDSKEPTLRREFIYYRTCDKNIPKSFGTKRQSSDLASNDDGTSAPKKAKREKKVDKKGLVPLQNNSSSVVSQHAECCSRQHGLHLEQVRDGDMSDDLHDLLDSAVDEFHSQISQSVVVSAAVCCSAGNDDDCEDNHQQLNGSDSNDSDYSDTCGSSSGSDNGESREYDELDSEDILGDIFDFC